MPAVTNLAAAAAVEDGPPLHLLFPLASSLLYVAAALSLKRASEHRAGIWRSTFVMNLVAAACFAPLLLFGPRGEGPTPLWQAGAIALLFVGGQVLTMVALNRGDVSVATPVMGTKVVFVAIFVTLVFGDPLLVDYWVSAAMSAAGIALLNLGGNRGRAAAVTAAAGEGADGASVAAAGGAEGDAMSNAPGNSGPVVRHRHLGLTIIASLSAASCYALFDVLVRKWSPAWGVGRLLPAIMALAAGLSLPLWPLFEGRLSDLPRPARGPLLLGALLIGLQALSLVTTLGLFADTTRINIVYNTRGLWSVVAVWLVGHWWGNTERHAGRTAFLWRLAGAALMLGAIVIAVTHPLTN